MKLLKIIILTLLFASFLFAQEDEVVTFISIKSNLRGTPTNQGLVITTANRGETGVIIKKAGAWYLIQMPKYVGWVHGNNIQTEDGVGETIVPLEKVIKPTPVPRGSYIPESGSSPFSSEYVGGNMPPKIQIENKTIKTLTIIFGGVKFVIPKETSKEIVIDPGAYRYDASAPGVNSLSGTKQFDTGYRYVWTFVIITRRTR